jgi:hypothetical protein
MSDYAKTTIDNLPKSASTNYAHAQTATNTRFYQDIQRPQTPRPQVAVFSPTDTSQLDALTGTGVLGKKQTLALFDLPQNSLNGQVFTHTVFPGFLEKDRPLVLERLKALDHPDLIDKIASALETLSQLNQMGLDAFNRCQQLKQG